MPNGPIASEGLAWGMTRILSLARRRTVFFHWLELEGLYRDIKRHKIWSKLCRYNSSIISIVGTPFCFALFIMGNCFVTKAFLSVCISSECFTEDSE